MRLERPKEIERLGAVRFGDLQRIFELDSGPSNGCPPTVTSAVMRVGQEALAKTESEMAIVVPVRNERLKLIEGVLCGIPHPCFIIVVSNSPRAPVDRFAMEQDALQEFCTFTGKQAVIVHQKDPAVGAAFAAAGYPSLLNARKEIRDGKAEGMLLGTVLARLAGKRTVGFIDADNYFPGAVEEYARAYASVFATSDSPYTMVRIAWHSKPKIVESRLFFRKWGRTSARTNQYLNRLLTHYTGFETEIIKTGNAGEHAMSLDLAMALAYSSGYSIEPYHIVNLMEQFGGIVESNRPDIMKHKVEVYQVESRNPHLHEAGDDSHIDGMSYLAMQVIYHSPVCPPTLRKELQEAMVKQGFLEAGRRPARPRYFPPLDQVDLGQFSRRIAGEPFARALLHQSS
jgi:mannosyl-3-phosphoglycerate synthase